MTTSGLTRIRQRVKRSLVNGRVGRESRGASERLEAADPRFNGLAAAARRCCEEIRSDHDDYVRNVSSPDMAVSLPTAGLLAAMYTALAPRVVLDMGSGFSTFVALRYAKDADVVGVDDDRLWLGKSAEYLSTKGYPGANLVPLEDLETVTLRPDVIFYDLGRMETRSSNLGRALSLVAASGAVVIDDLHKFPYCSQVFNRTKRDGTMYWTRDLTLDPLGRYSAVWRPA